MKKKSKYLINKKYTFKLSYSHFNKFIDYAFNRIIILKERTIFFLH